MKHRLLLNPLPQAGSEVDLPEDESRHARVLRLRAGEQIELFDGDGQGVLAEVISALPTLRVRLLSAAPAREAVTKVTLCLALIQPEKFELSIQKATELGVAEIQPLITDLCEVRVERIAGKLERWRKIAAEAAKQCGRTRIPAVHEPDRPAGVLGHSRGLNHLLFDATGGALPTLKGPLAAFIGPEGGWSDEELAAFQEAGTPVVSLGTRRLRAETAAIVASALLIGPWNEQ